MSEKIIINVKINVSLIDRAKLFKGANGTYLDISLIETPNGKFGNDFMVVQDTTKDERLSGKKGAILGNAKYFKRKTREQQLSGEAPDLGGGTPPF